MDVYSRDWNSPMLLQSLTYKEKNITYLEIHQVLLLQQEHGV